MDAMPAKIMPGRKAGKDHARSQCCLWQEARPTSSGSDAGKYIPGSDAALQEASQVNRQRSTVLRVNPSSDKINRERALSRGSLRSREKREEPVIGQMRRKAPRNTGGRKAGKDHARSQCPLRGEDLQCQSLLTQASHHKQWREKL